MENQSPRERISAWWRWFAEVSAPRRSPLYEQIAAAVADDPHTLDFLASMPPPKWQPNLLLAAVRYLYGTPPDARAFLRLVAEHRDELAAVMAVRSTQTNEPARCATLLPALAALPGPLALLEVGASAGLCLLPDRYGYDYRRVQVPPSAPLPNLEAPVFPCRADDATPLPSSGLEVAWRAGLDLHPVDLRDEDEVRWLEALVWPGEDYRIPRLRQACALARADPPRVVRGDLRYDLPALAAEAPADATLVVFHTAVLAYLPDAREREAFARTVADLGAVWIANEGPERHPFIDPDSLNDQPSGEAFLLAVNGRPVAWTDGHGTWIQWRAA